MTPGTRAWLLRQPLDPERLDYVPLSEWSIGGTSEGDGFYRQEATRQHDGLTIAITVTASAGADRVRTFLDDCRVWAEVIPANLEVGGLDAVVASSVREVTGQLPDGLLATWQGAEPVRLSDLLGDHADDVARVAKKNIARWLLALQADGLLDHSQAMDFDASDLFEAATASVLLPATEDEGGAGSAPTPDRPGDVIMDVYSPAGARGLCLSSDLTLRIGDKVWYSKSNVKTLSTELKMTLGTMRLRAYAKSQKTAAKIDLQGTILKNGTLKCTRTLPGGAPGSCTASVSAGEACTWYARCDELSDGARGYPSLMTVYKGTPPAI